LIEQSYRSDKSVVAANLNDIAVHVSFAPTTSLSFGKEGELNLKVVKVSRVGKNSEKSVDVVCMDLLLYRSALSHF
jgi:hypothetical protein